MASGQAPFQGHYEQAILYSILHEAPEPITALRTGIPPELERIANKCLAKRADERYQTVGDLLADLGALKRSRESSEGKRQSSGTRDARPSIAVLPFQNRSRDEEDGISRTASPKTSSALWGRSRVCGLHPALLRFASKGRARQ